MDASQQDAWDWDWEVLLPDHRSSSSVRHHHGSKNNNLDGKDRPSLLVSRGFGYGSASV
jgi:hypothetical protein